VTRFAEMKMQTLVLDEAHRIKNPKSARTKGAMALMNLNTLFF